MATVQTYQPKTRKVVRGYSNSSIYGWQRENQSALDILNQYNQRVQNGEWLSNDDRARYKSAIDTYTSSGNALRNVSKYYGTKYTNDEEKSWQDSLSSLNQGYTGINDFYNQFADENQYTTWKDRENKRAEYQAVLTSPDYSLYGDKNAIFMLYSSVPLNGNPKELAEVSQTNKLRDKYMTAEDRSILAYYINKGDNAKVDEFLEFKDAEFKEIEAGRLAEKYDDTAMELLFSASAGLEQFGNGLSNVGNALFGKEPASSSVYQNASAIMGKNNAGIWKGANDLTQTVTNQVPSLLANVFAPGVGSVSNALSAGGNAYAEIYEKYGANSARAYGIMTGASEYLLSKALGGIPGLGGGDGVFQKIGSKILPGVNNAIARTAIQLGGNILDEALEEGVQTALDPVFKWATTLGEEELNKVNWEEIGYSALLGGLSAGVFGGVTTIPNSVSITQRAQKAYGNQATDVVAQALEFNPNDKLAQMVQTRLDKGKNVSGLALNELAQNIEQGYTKQDSAKIKSAVESRLAELGESENVSALAEALTKKTVGEDLSIKEKNLIKNSKFGERITNELNRQNIQSGQYSTAWAEGIGTKRVNADVYNLRERITTPSNQDATQEVYAPSDVARNAANVSENAQVVAYAAKDKMSKVQGFTEEAANAMTKGYDGKVGASEYIRTFDEAYKLGLNGAQATSVVNLAHNSEGINQSTLLAAYELGRQAKENSVLQTPVEGDIINTESEVLIDEGTDTVHLRDSGERLGGTNPQESIQQLEGSTGQAERGGGSVRPADSEAAQLVNEGRQVRVADLGILNGSKTQTVRLVDTNKETTAMKKARKDAEAQGLKIKFFVGDNIVIIEKNGNISSVRAYVLGDQMLVRADHPVYTADQLERHEAGHKKIERGEVDVKAVRKRLIELVGEENVDQVAQLYADAYAGTGMTAEEIWKECICDSLGDMNIFAKSKELASLMDYTIKETKKAVAEQKAEPNQTRGSPAAKSKSKNSGVSKIISHLKKAGNRYILTDGNKTYVSDGFSFVAVSSDTLQEVKEVIPGMRETELPQHIKKAFENKSLVTDSPIQYKGDRTQVYEFKNDKAEGYYNKKFVTLIDGETFYLENKKLNPTLFAVDKNGELYGAVLPLNAKKQNNVSKTFAESLSEPTASNLKSFKNRKTPQAEGKASRESDIRYSLLETEHKQKQFEIIQETNPMWDDYHVGIRTADDINTRYSRELDIIDYMNAMSEGEVVTKITADMTEEERYEALKKRSINNIPLSKEISSDIIKKNPEISSWEDINNFFGKSKKNLIKKLAEEFIVFKEYTNRDINLSFEFSRHNFSESYQKQNRNYESFAKMFSVFDDVIDGAVGIEIHNRTDYKPDPTLDKMFVLMGAYQDGQFIVPVKLEVKKFNDKQNTLYVAISLEKIKMAELNARGNTENGVTQRTRSTNISIAHIFEKINPIDKDFLKYIPDGFLNSEQKAAKHEALREDAGDTYMSAIKRNDMQAAQKMIDEAAKKAGFSLKLFHQTSENFTIFDTKHKGSGSNDDGTPFGVFMKPADNDIGLKGKKQMALYARLEHPFIVNDRAQLESKLKQMSAEYTQVMQKQKELTSEYREKIEEAEKAWSQYAKDYRISHPNASRTELNHDETFNTLFDAEDALVEEWIEKANELSLKAKEIITNVLIANGYDSVILKKDEGSAGRIVETYIALNANQVKSADPVTYDDDGNVIPLSERFNTDNNDIRYSRELDVIDYMNATSEFEGIDELAFSNRSLLANALLDTITSSEEYKLIRSYQEEIAKLDANDKKLAQLKKDLNQLYKQEKPNFEVINELREKINALEGEIVKRDKRLLRLESTTALKNVLERARKDAYAKAMQKGKETMHRAVEGRHKTIERNKIKNIAHELDTLLNKGNKKRNVKIGAQGVVRAALDLSDMYFVSDDDLIMNGIQTEALERENTAIEKYRALYEQLHSTDGDVTNHKEERAQIRHEMNEVKKNFAELLERERKRISNVKASSVYDALIKEYEKLANSPSNHISQAFDEDALGYIKTLKAKLGNKLVSEMTLEDLQNVYKVFTMVKTMVSNSNKLFKSEVNATVEQYGAASLREIESKGHKERFTALGNSVSAFSWNNLKPVYLMERTGSGTLEELFQNILDGEGVWAKDMEHARDYIRKQKTEFNFDSWDFDTTHEFKTPSGKTFKLNLEQIMTIYAYSKRGEQALEHLRTDGFVFDKVIVKKKGIEYELNDKTAYKITDETRIKIIGALTHEQREYVDAMQEYLSKTMGAKGNEVSVAMYGIELYGDKNYLPIHSEGAYLERAREQAKGDVKLKNKGFTKTTIKHARNAIVLSEFDKLCTEHIAEMSSYHAFTLALEDFYKVYNYQVASDDLADKRGVIPALENAYGKGATQAIDQLLTDLNGGARSDPRETLSKKAISLHKKAKVMASLSVVIQQPSSILRAQAMIDPKYFIGQKVGEGKHKELWAEMKKYAPVTIIKEMGYFDVGMGKSSADWLLSEQYEGFGNKVRGFFTDGEYRDEVFSKPAAYADEVTWIAIWNAVKRETANKNPSINTSSKEFLEKAGARFEDVIRHTQVYDSTLARSGNMRSKSAFMQMATSFMAEQTTSLNMREAALRSKDKKRMGRTAAAIYASALLNSILVALPYAMRDDDEDETFWEKYITALSTSFVSNINPISSIPFVKDVWSLAQGYGVDRADMSIAGDFIDSFKKFILTMTDENRKPGDIENAILNLVGDISTFTGLPLDNVRRDVMSVYNTYKTFTRGYDTTWKSIEDALQKAFREDIPVLGWFKGESKNEKLYEAIIAGDEKYVERFRLSYDDEDKYESALRKAIRENDSRVKEAALAKLAGDNDTYYNLMMDVIEEGHFDRALIKEAFDAEYRYHLNKKKEAEENGEVYP